MKYICKCGTPIDATVDSNVCPNCGLAVKPENDISGGMVGEQEKMSNRIDTLAKDGANAPRGSAPSDKRESFKDRGQNSGGERPQREGGRSSHHTAKENDYKNLEQIVKDYEIHKDPSKIISLIASFDENIALLDIDGNWRPFLILAARAAVENENTELQNYLKNHAKDYDAKWKSGKLFYSMFLACPKLHLTNNEWMGLIKETGGDSAAFDKISEYLIQYIVETCDKSFAIDVFTNLKKLSKKHTGWATVCEGYARALFTSNAIADMVFTKTTFVKQGAARKFVKYCKARLHGGVSIEASRVWDNYVAACNVRRGRVLIGIVSVLVAIIAAMIAFNVYLASVSKDTVSFTVDKMIEVTYGEKLSLDGYYLTYKTHGGEEVKEPLSESMLIGYDPEAVGSQQIYFEFHGVQEPVTIVVKATQLETPVLTQSGHYITWETVPYAESYAIFVNASEVKTNETSGLRYDLSENPSFGALTVTVRAMSTSGKYISSEMSAPITVTKLEAPKNIEYSEGKLTWTAVEGATGYELTVNGIPYLATAPECTLSLNCGSNEITVIAKSSDKSVIPGVTVKNDMYYNRLDPITSMSYRDGTLSWQAGADAKTFLIYVDGVLWKEISRNNFSFENDGFAQTFGAGAHKIEIVCKTSASGVEPSDKVGYNVSFGNKTSIGGGLVRWQNIGVGSTYFVYVNGVLHTYNDSYFSVSDCTWQNGVNEVSIVARLNGEEYICETFTVKKHAAPTVSVTDTGWFLETVGGELYSVNGGEWTSTLPDISAIAPGVHTVRAKRAVSAPDAFEIESDITEITVSKPVAPVIRLNMGVLECSTFDSEALELVLEYYDANINSWIAIDSVEAIVHAGEYRLRAYFRAKASVGGTVCALSSDRSAELRVRMPEAPNVVYDAATGRLSSSTPGARFYYLDENGAEHEIPEGKVSNLPGGVFKVYARLNATDSNTLNSRNTPEQEQVSVFNLDIDFAVSPIAGSNQCYLLFSGCNEIDSITYSYKVNYLDASGQTIGGLDRSYSFSTQGKTSPSADSISCLINYRTGGEFNGNYTQNDVSKIEVIVYIDGGTETLWKSYTASVK